MTRVKFMSREIERKFKVLVDKLPDLSNITPTWISQTYLWKNPEIRVRILKKDNEIWSTLTIKSQGLFSRFERNFRIPIWLADRLFPLGIDSVIKERFFIPRPEKHFKYWELDRYVSDIVFWLTEVELEDKNEPVLFRDWAGKEVTFDARYYAQNIVRTIQEIKNGTFQEKEENI